MKWLWLRYGIRKGWVSEPACATHDGLPLSDEEEQLWEQGDDPCTIGVRVWMLEA